MTDPPVSPLEHSRRAFVNSVVRILNAWNPAVNDANARGYPTRLFDPSRGDAENTSVEAAALTRSEAREWLHDLETAITPIIVLANRSQLLWPPIPKPGTIRGSVTVGQRGNPNDAESCLVCRLPCYPGDRRAAKTSAGEVEGYVHKSPCWYTLTMNRKGSTT